MVQSRVVKCPPTYLPINLHIYLFPHLSTYLPTYHPTCHTTNPSSYVPPSGLTYPPTYHLPTHVPKYIPTDLHIYLRKQYSRTRDIKGSGDSTTLLHSILSLITVEDSRSSVCSLFPLPFRFSPDC